MVLPENTEVFELPTATMWFDENGILCSIAKKVPQQTVEEAKKTMEEFRKITGGKNILVINIIVNMK